MINLILLNDRAFQLDGSVLPRQFQVIVTRENVLYIRNVNTGYRILLGSLFNVTINGFPVPSMEELRELVYNFSCGCSGTGGDTEYKIFDITFDITFE